MAQAGGHECAHLQGLEGPRHWEGGSQPADLLGARGDVGLWAGAPSPKPTPSYPPGSRWSSTSTRTPSRRGLSCSSSKTKDPVSGVCRGAEQRGSVGAGGAMGVLLVSAPCHLPGWKMLGPWGGAPLLEAGLATATKATSSAPRSLAPLCGPLLCPVGSLHLPSQQEPGHLGCRMGCRGGACGFWSIDL